MTPLSGETQGNHHVYFVIGQLCLHLALFIEEGIIIGGFFLVVAKAVRTYLLQIQSPMSNMTIVPISTTLRRLN